MRYSFSGHESFHCKSLWLKKGYDFICNKKHFADTDSVVELGVGKNMVSAIRYWLKAFSLTKEDTLTDLAEYIFSTNTGRDPFCEDIATLWVLHYNLVKSQVASIYQLVFIDFQRERREFDKVQLLSFIKRKCSVPEQKNVYNENTVSKDINVFLHSYIEPNDLKQLERYSALLINLGLMREIEKGVYRFQEIDTDSIPDVVILYALCDIKGEDNAYKELYYAERKTVCKYRSEALRYMIEQYKKDNKAVPTSMIKYSDRSYLLQKGSALELLDKEVNALESVQRELVRKITRAKYDLTEAKEE